MKFDEITQSKQTEKPVEIPSAEVKPSLGRRLLRTFVPENPKDVFEYYLWHRWLPGVANGICDIFADMVYGTFNGISGGRMRGRDGSRRYRGSERSSLNDSSVGRVSIRSWREWRDIKVTDKWASEDVAQKIIKHVMKYDGRLSMRQYFEFWQEHMPNIKVEWTSCDYGWENLNPDDVRAVPMGGGYYGIEMPGPVLIK